MSTTATLGCSQTHCHAPDTACILGHEPCQHFTQDADVASGDVGSGQALPWSGLPLGLGDLAAVAATGPTRLVALVGPPGAGKTTALAAHWIAARRGAGERGASFAGSFTLIGWQQIARHLQWVPFGSGGFPPHTSASTNRSPALLHIAQSTATGLVHVLYTDVPGEWYQTWAYDAAAVPAVLWIADNADVFVLLADSEALSGPERGRARGDYESLATRVASVSGDRPVVPVRTKVDIDVPDPLLAFVDARNHELFGTATTSVSVHERTGTPITAAVDLALTAALRPRLSSLPAEQREHDPLLAFRSATADMDGAP